MRGKCDPFEGGGGDLTANVTSTALSEGKIEKLLFFESKGEKQTSHFDICDPSYCCLTGLNLDPDTHSLNGLASETNFFLALRSRIVYA